MNETNTDGVDASEDDFKTAVLRCRYPVCNTIHPSGWGWDTSRLNEVIADHAGVRDALRQIADMDPEGQRADDLGRAARVARDALTALGVGGTDGR